MKYRAGELVVGGRLRQDTLDCGGETGVCLRHHLRGHGLRGEGGRLPVGE